jgi:hypothetical protein
VFGAVVACGRFITILAIVFTVQAPAAAYLILVPGMTVHVTFGALSGYITYHLVRAWDVQRSAAEARAKLAPEHEPDHEEVA